MHVAATYDGTTIHLFINGIEENQTAANFTIAANTTNLGIGAEPAASVINLFQGSLDDARIYNRALTSCREIATLAGITLTPPTAPSSLTATVAPGSQIDLAWTDNSNNETGFQIETAPGPACTVWASLGSSGANTNSFRHWNTTVNTQYCYRVRAAGSGGNSDWSNTATASTPASYSALSLGRDQHLCEHHQPTSRRSSSSSSPSKPGFDGKEQGSPTRRALPASPRLYP